MNFNFDINDPRLKPDLNRMREDFLNVQRPNISYDNTMLKRMVDDLEVRTNARIVANEKNEKRDRRIAISAFIIATVTMLVTIGQLIVSLLK